MARVWAGRDGDVTAVSALTIGSLFSGIGGLELGLERGIGHGAHTVWQVEKDPYCQRVLARHWPHTYIHEDVRDVGYWPAQSGKLTRGNLQRVDVVCGGFPCQDISYAGLGAGLAGERSGLWHEFARIVREVGPRYVVVENVAALLVRGLGRVLGDLAACGYDAEWDCVPASAVGAPHRRDRVFVLAHDRGQRIQRGWTRPLHRVPAFSWCEDVRGIEDLRSRPDLPPSLFRGSRDGIPDWVDRLRALGNAVVPQVAEVVGRLIAEREAQNSEAA